MREWETSGNRRVGGIDGGDAFACIGEAFNRGEGSLGQCQSLGKVSGGSMVWNEPVA